MKQIIIEIGAFDGEDTEKYLQNRNVFVYCFEPNIDYANKLKERFANKDNIKIINKAVGTYDGVGKLWIAEKKMSSSMNTPSQYSIDNLIIKNENTQSVEVVNLKTFIIENEIQQIDYLHCDAQGSDFNILKSLGDKISIIKRGQVEGSRNENLYDTENRYNRIIEYLEKNNFKVLNKDEIEKRSNWLDLNILFINKNYETVL